MPASIFHAVFVIIFVEFFIAFYHFGRDAAKR